MPREVDSYQSDSSDPYNTHSVFTEYNPFAESFLYSFDPDEDADHLIQPVHVEPQNETEVEPSKVVVLEVKEDLPQAA